MECQKEKNIDFCTCTYRCDYRGMCCLCIQNHRDRGEIPGCLFTKEGEKTYDRSFKNFVKYHR
ncbi:MAG: DUF6485 family protein [Candidatus Hydrogenedentota bacterium]